MTAPEDERQWERMCRRCGRPFGGNAHPSPIGWMHYECARIPIAPHVRLPTDVLNRLSHRLLTLDGNQVVYLDGACDFHVAGSSFHRTAFLRLVGPPERSGHHVETAAMLVPELTNPHDPNAVAVHVGGLLVGYVPRTSAAFWRDAVFHLIERYSLPVACGAVISGGVLRKRSKRPAEWAVLLRLPIPLDAVLVMSSVRAGYP